MLPHLKTFLCLTILSCFSTLLGCGVLFPDRANLPPTVLVATKVETPPLLLDPTCPPEPIPPPKPQGHNTLSEPAAIYWNDFDAWAMACRDLNDAIEAILRPSTEAKKTEPKPTEVNKWLVTQ